MSGHCFTKFSALPVVFLVSLALTVGQNARIENKNPGMELKNKTDWVNRPDIMYEVTSFISGNRTLNIKDTITDKAYLFGNITPAFYYDIEAPLFRDICWTVFLPAQYSFDSHKVPSMFISTCINYLGLNGISIIINKNASEADVANLKATSSTNALVLSLLDGNKPFLEFVTFKITYYFFLYNCPELLKETTKYLQENVGIFDSGKRRRSKVKLGLEYNIGFLECFESGNNTLIESLNHTILHVDVEPYTTLLTYSHFSKMMENLVTTNRYAVRKLNADCALYVRLVMGNREQVIHDKAYKGYQALVADYFQRWSAQYNGDDIFIVTPTQQHASPLNSTRFIKDSVSAVFYEGETFSGNSTEDIPELACESIQMAINLRSVFNKIIFYNPSLNLLRKLMTTCHDLNDQQLKLEQSQLNSNCLLFSSGSVSLELIVNTLQNLSLNNELNTGFHTVYFDHRILENQDWHELLSQQNQKSDRNRSKNRTQTAASLLLTNTTHLLRSVFSGVGCYLQQSQQAVKDSGADFVNKTVELCGTLFHASTNILVYFPLEIKEKWELLQFLARVHQIKETFKERYPDKNLIPMIAPSTVTNGILDRDAYYSSIYCNSALETGNEYLETVITFANLHKWKELSVSINPPHPDNVGFWQNVKTDSEVDRISTSFSVFYRSNSENMELAQLAWTYPCVKWPEKVSGKVSFLSNRYAGATFDVRLRPYNMKERELHTTLAFALGEFPFAELIARDRTEFKMAINILTPEFFEAVQNYSLEMKSVHATGQPLLYIQVPITDFLRTEYDGNATDYGMVHVHLSEWETVHQDNHTISKNYTGDHLPKLGITVDDCTQEMNQRLVRLIRWPMMKHVSYIVCYVKPILLNNLNIIQMQKYLGTLFYTKSYMEKFIRGKNDKGNVEVIFRINAISTFKKCPENKDPEADQFLRFIYNLNQHSAIYKIKYFLVQAFSKEDTCDQCTPTWWRIRNYTDLKDISVYMDRQQEYFHEQTKLKIELPPEEQRPFISTESPSGNSFVNIYLYITVPVIGSLVLLAVLALWLQRRHYENFLSRKEVREFYNGQRENRDGIMMGDLDCLDSSSMGFPKRFEVRAREIETKAMIGSGQFGIVYKGHLSNHGVVAIKVPRTDCSKEQFKSTLSELKILCYIGSHENVVSFLGACTKEIAGGKLHILTDYCEHGSLQKYLRGRQQEVVGESGTSPPLDISILYEFCYQIACGMEYVAEKRVIHGDLAARNVLLASEYICKISDFGLSRRLYELQEYVKTSTEPLPWRWMAPESLKNMEFTTKSDVWSYGVVLWEIFSLGTLPYPGTSWTPDFIAELDSGLRMGKAQHSSEDIHGTILTCWAANPEERPTFTQLKEYFSQLRSNIYTVLNSCNDNTHQE